GALDVGVEDPVEVLLRRLGEWDELGDAGIHEQHIEPAELTAYLVHDMVEVSRDGDVRSNGDELIGPRELAELRHGRPQRARITPGNDHDRTGLEKLLGGGEALAPPQTQPDCPVGCARGFERPDPAGDRAAALAQRRTQLFGVPILRVQDESQLSLGAPADRGTRTDPSRGHVPHAVAPGGRRGSPVSGVAPGGAYERGGRGSPTRAANE